MLFWYYYNRGGDSLEGHVKHKDFFYVVILILTFITVIVGTTFALYSFIFSQKEGTSAVYTGTLSIEYLSGDIINCNYLYPLDNPTITAVNNVYKNNFRVKNKGSLDSLLQIKIDITSNNFYGNELRYVIYNSNQEEVANGSIEGSNVNIIANSIYLKNNTTEEFTLMIWLQESGSNQNNQMKRNLIGTIEVDASQKID